MKFDFTIPECSPHDVLSLEDLRFFYYDIGVDQLSIFPAIYNWNNVIIEYKEKFKIIIFKSTDNIPEKFEDDIIKFKVADNKKESPCEAFLRHLRNSFMHYRIIRNQEWFYITDRNPQTSKITMIGKVKAEFLKDFCFRLFDQRESILNQYNI